MKKQLLSSHKSDIQKHNLVTWHDIEDWKAICKMLEALPPSYTGTSQLRYLASAATQICCYVLLEMSCILQQCQSDIFHCLYSRIIQVNALELLEAGYWGGLLHIAKICSLFRVCKQM
ncbi:hypothetical protein EJB05_11933, partial [Eragrostis curvula]